MTRLSATLLSLSLLTGCGLDPARVADHALFADDGDSLQSQGALSFAVVGNVRDPLLLQDKLMGKRAYHEGVADAVVQDILTATPRERLSFLALMGDSVRRSATKEWRVFDRRFRNVLEGATFPDAARTRIPVVPVFGERDYASDRLLKGAEGAFPGVGADIGYNRVGSWSTFDIQSQDSHWRFVVLDTNKKALGPRWVEQLSWIPEAVKGDDYDSLVVLMHHPVATLATGRDSNYQGAPAELLEALDDAIGFQKLRAVFSADPSTTEVFLEGGRYGTLHVGAGGGGAPADDLQRWGVNSANDKEALKLEPIFDMAMVKAFDKRAETAGYPESVVDAARAEGSYKGFPGVFLARHFPLYGWWAVTVDGPQVHLSYRLWSPGGGFQEVYLADYEGEKGWKIGAS